MDLSSELNNIKIRGKIDRIDSVNGVTRVIDYKTGNYKIDHEIQINSYAEALSKMGKKNIERVLIYISDDIKVKRL